jgi:catechol 2,3-dioxygenase-like lactoylglutathione lyase family enzyme
MCTTAELIPEPLIEPQNKKSVVKPYVLSHGTLECYSLKASRRFYEEFLGLECVRHGPRTMAIRCALKFHIVCVEVGDRLKPVHMMNHWGVDVQSKAEVNAAYEAALRMKEEFGISEIHAPVDQHGVYSFYIVDLDKNWWEIQYFSGFQHDDMFDFGDMFPMDQVAPLAGKATAS